MTRTTRLIALAIAAAALTACMPNYSNGDRTGTISKLSRKGLACKTWEGELVMGGTRATVNADTGATGTAANVFAFTLEDSQVAAAQAAMETGTPVKLTYHEYLVAGPCSGDSDYRVTSVKAVR